MEWVDSAPQKAIKVCAVIPAHNEAKTIGNIIQETKKYVETIIVVDDGSADDTAKIAAENGAQVIYHPANKGYGAAQRTGHHAAIQNGFEYILQLDADGQHDPKYIPELLKEGLTGDYDLVLGSRFLNGSYKDYPLVRKIGITFFTKVVNILGRAQLTDVTSGFKVYKVSGLKKLSRASDKHPAVEQMLEMARRRMRIKEISIEMPLRTNGESHLNFKRYALYPLRMIFSVIKVMILLNLPSLSFNRERKDRKSVV